MKLVLEMNIGDEAVIDDELPNLLRPLSEMLLDILNRDATPRQLINLVRENAVGKPDDLILGESGLVGIERPFIRVSLSDEPFDTTHAAAHNPDAYNSSANAPHLQEHRDEARN